jgi:hypothetical protein
MIKTLGILIIIGLLGCRESSPSDITDAGLDQVDVAIEPTPCTSITLQAASTMGIQEQYVVHCRYGADGRTWSVVGQLEQAIPLLETPEYQECTRPGRVLFSAELCDLDIGAQVEYIEGRW